MKGGEEPSVLVRRFTVWTGSSLHPVLFPATLECQMMKKLTKSWSGWIGWGGRDYVSAGWLARSILHVSSKLSTNVNVWHFHHLLNKSSLQYFFISSAGSCWHALPASDGNPGALRNPGRSCTMAVIQISWSNKAMWPGIRNCVVQGTPVRSLGQARFENLIFDFLFNLRSRGQILLPESDRTDLSSRLVRCQNTERGYCLVRPSRIPGSQYILKMKIECINLWRQNMV